MTTAAVILAAGAGRRFSAQGEPGAKLRAPLGGRSVVRRAVDAAVSARLDEVVVVVGAAAIEDLLPPGVTVVRNDEWADGMATSLARAVDHAARAGHEAVVVGLGDQPFVPSTAWRAVADAVDTPISVATYAGRRRNPVRLDRAIWDLLPRAGDDGARIVMDLRPELVTEVPCAGDPADVDTQEDLDRWS